MKKVLIVDDNLEVCLLYKSVISGQLGCNVRITTSPHEALEWLDQEKFDVILSDMRMPGMSGIEFIQAARQKGVMSKIITITAFAHYSNTDQLAHLNIYTCLVKPISLAKLEEVIKKALSQKQMIRRWKVEREKTASKPPKNQGIDTTLKKLQVDGSSHSIKIAALNCRLWKNNLLTP